MSEFISSRSNENICRICKKKDNSVSQYSLFGTICQVCINEKIKVIINE